MTEILSDQNICMDVKGFLAFIVTLSIMPFEMQATSERIKMVQDAARRSLKGLDKSGEDTDQET